MSVNFSFYFLRHVAKTRLRMRFLSTYLDLANQRNYYENAKQCGKRMGKRNVATRLKIRIPQMRENAAKDTPCFADHLL